MIPSGWTFPKSSASSSTEFGRGETSERRLIIGGYRNSYDGLRTFVGFDPWIAEQERARLIERTNAGLDRAKRKGVRLGRPQTRVDVWQAERLLAGGASLRKVAEELRVPLGTLHQTAP